MVLLHFSVKTDIVLQGKLFPVDHITSNTISLAAWIGGPNNQNLAYNVFDPKTATTEIKLEIQNNDVDTIKFQQSIERTSPVGTRAYCLASSFMPVTALLDLLSNQTEQKCFCMASNFDANASILYLTNLTTDIPKVRTLALQPSILHETQALNSVMTNLCTQLQSRVASMGIPPEIGAPQFIPINTNTFLPMHQVQTAYPVVPELFNNIQKNIPIPLAWHMYDLYKTITSTNLHPDLLKAMPDKELVMLLGCPMLQNRCNCALTSPYDSDETLDGLGLMDKDTEEISRTFSQLSFASQLRTQVKTDTTPTPKTLPEMVQALVQWKESDLTKQPRTSMAALIDDCENTAQGLKIQHTSLKQLYLDKCKKSEARLLALMLDEAKEYPNLFSQLTQIDHKQACPVLFRLAKLAGEGQWNTAMTVVTARNRAMDANGTIASSLAGHGVCISQLIDDKGDFHYTPMEGTTSMKVHPSKAMLNRKDDLQVLLPDGQVKPMSISDYATIFAQNVHAIAAFSPQNMVQASLAENEDYVNDWSKSPFYMGAFYTGFAMEKTSLGCMPCLKQNFGAPVVWFSKHDTVAEPITPDTAGMSKQVFTTKLQQQIDEAWPPFATESQIKALMQHWSPVQPLPYKRLRTQDNYKNYITTMVSCAFDRPEHRAMALKVYQSVADTFNQKQRARGEKDDDGHRIAVDANYLSVCLHISLRLPPEGECMKTGAITNLRDTVEELGLTRLMSCPLKRAMINSRMKLESKHPFYVCDKSKRVVHAFNQKLH